MLETARSRAKRAELRGTYAQEDLTEDDIVLILEVDGIDDGDTILTLGSDEGALLATVGDIENLVGDLAGVELSKDVLEGLSVDVTLEEGKTLSKLVCTGGDRDIEWQIRYNPILSMQ